MCACVYLFLVNQLPPAPLPGVVFYLHLATDSKWGHGFPAPRTDRKINHPKSKYIIPGTSIIVGRKQKHYITLQVSTLLVAKNVQYIVYSCMVYCILWGSAWGIPSIFWLGIDVQSDGIPDGLGYGYLSLLGKGLECLE